MAVTPTATADSSAALNALSLYELFLHKLAQETRSSPQTAAELQSKLDINKTQLNQWLKKSITEKKAIKLSKPIRYQVVTDTQRSLDL